MPGDFGFYSPSKKKTKKTQVCQVRTETGVVKLQENFRFQKLAPWLAMYTVQVVII